MEDLNPRQRWGFWRGVVLLKYRVWKIKLFGLSDREKGRMDALVEEAERRIKELEGRNDGPGPR